MQKFTLLLLLLAGVGCGNPIIVHTRHLVPGDDGRGTQSGPALEILIRMRADATDFNPGDLMRVLVGGVEYTDDVKLGGDYGVLRISPPPPVASRVELFRREGPVIDTFTWTVNPYTGPTLANVAPTSARRGTAVTLTGTGFVPGSLRVFFGGVAGTVDACTDTSITATVPAEAVPGLVLVLVGDDAAEGIADFLPLDDMDVAIPFPNARTLSAAFPLRGPPGTIVRIYGYEIEDNDEAAVSGRDTGRVIGYQTMTLPTIGDILFACVVLDSETPSGRGEIVLEFGASGESNALPFTVDSDN